MSKRVVYIEPATAVEFRFVDEDVPKNARGWKDQFRPSKR